MRNLVPRPKFFTLCFLTYDIRHVYIDKLCKLGKLLNLSGYWHPWKHEERYSPSSVSVRIKREHVRMMLSTAWTEETHNKCVLLRRMSSGTVNMLIFFLFTWINLILPLQSGGRGATCSVVLFLAIWLWVRTLAIFLQAMFSLYLPLILA